MLSDFIKSLIFGNFCGIIAVHKFWVLKISNKTAKTGGIYERKK